VTAAELIEQLIQLPPESGIGVAMVSDRHAGDRTEYALDNVYIIETTADYLGGHFLFCLLSEAAHPYPRQFPIPAGVADDLDRI
jgi:hypothetical protein